MNTTTKLPQRPAGDPITRLREATNNARALFVASYYQHGVRVDYDGDSVSTGQVWALAVCDSCAAGMRMRVSSAYQLIYLTDIVRNNECPKRGHLR